MNNTVDQTVNVVPEIIDNGDGTGSYQSNDGTTATVVNGEVAAVTDDAGTVDVTSGDTNPEGTVTSNPLGGSEEGGGSGEDANYTESDYDNAL